MKRSFPRAVHPPYGLREEPSAHQQEKHGHENIFPHIGTTASETAPCSILIGKAGNSFFTLK